MKKLDYSHHSVGVYLSVLRQICDIGVMNGDIDVNPTAVVSVPKGLKTKKREIPSDNIIKAVNGSTDNDFDIFAYFLMFTGLRKGEALALKWKDNDFENKKIMVSRSLLIKQSKTKTTKTEAAIREVILLDRLSDALLKIKDKPEYFIFGGKEPITDKVFRRKWLNYCVSIGQYYVEEKNVVRRKKETIAHIKRATFTPHQLRHAFATFLYEQQIGIEDAQKLLGHSKAETTQDTYQHIRNSRLPDIANKLSQIEI